MQRFLLFIIWHTVTHTLPAYQQFNLGVGSHPPPHWSILGPPYHHKGLPLELGIRIPHSFASRDCQLKLTPKQKMRSLFPNNGHFGESASYMPQKSFPVRKIADKQLCRYYICIYTAHLTLPETNSPPQKRDHNRLFFQVQAACFFGRVTVYIPL